MMSELAMWIELQAIWLMCLWILLKLYDVI